MERAGYPAVGLEGDLRMNRFEKGGATAFQVQRSRFERGANKNTAMERVLPSRCWKCGIVPS